MKIHYLQHVSFEGPGAIGAWAKRGGHRLTATRFHDDDPLPSLDDLDWLVVMGGPMSVNEERAYAWLRHEKQFIESAIEAGKVVIGVCLGAQLIADVLGAKVYPNRFKEIGWFPIQRTADAAGTRLGDVLPEEFDAFHWHGDTFELPSGAIHLARSQACAHQAFVYRERVLALQFHLETTTAGVEQLSKHCASEIVGGPFIQPPAVMLADEGRFAKANELMSRLLDRLAELPICSTAAGPAAGR